MFNADGSEAEMCGNAVRCVAKFLYEKGICKQERIKLETASGVKVLELGCKGAVVERVRVDMGEPILSSSLIPVVHEKEQVIGEPFVVEDRELALTCVSMGNPHAVFFVPEINDDLVMGLGPKIECHGIFPKRINVEFVQVLSPEAVRMRVWERGSGETLACGTGACAVCVAAVLRGLCARSLRVELLGGELEIEWSEENNRVYMTGPAAVAFEGSVDLSGWV
jgi:diaminopimelate epimerase